MPNIYYWMVKTVFLFDSLTISQIVPRLLNPITSFSQHYDKFASIVKSSTESLITLPVIVPSIPSSVQPSAISIVDTTLLSPPGSPSTPTTGRSAPLFIHNSIYLSTFNFASIMPTEFLTSMLRSISTCQRFYNFIVTEAILPKTASNVIQPFSLVVVSPSPPSILPSSEISIAPSTTLSFQPEVKLSSAPTTKPSVKLRKPHTEHPTITPRIAPSDATSHCPSAEPTVLPSLEPSLNPTVERSYSSSTNPIIEPSCCPSISPSTEPTDTQTDNSFTPSLTHWSGLSARPSEIPSLLPPFDTSLLPYSDLALKPSIAIDPPKSSPILSCTPSTSLSFQSSTIPSVQSSDVPIKRQHTDPSSLPSYTPIQILSRLRSSDPKSTRTTLTTVDTISHPLTEATLTPSTKSSVILNNPITTIPTVRPSQNPSSIPARLHSANPSPPSIITTLNSIPTQNPSIVDPPDLSISVTSAGPTYYQTTEPSLQAVIVLSNTPIKSRGISPSALPTNIASPQPSKRPTTKLTSLPSKHPCTNPSTIPPSVNPVEKAPLSIPTLSSSVLPSTAPTVTLTPSTILTLCNSATPSTDVTALTPTTPTQELTFVPNLRLIISSIKLIDESLAFPSINPTFAPSDINTVEPSTRPSNSPGNDSIWSNHIPSMKPTAKPSLSLSKHASNCPSAAILRYHSTVSPTAHTPRLTSSPSKSGSLATVPTHFPNSSQSSTVAPGMVRTSFPSVYVEALASSNSTNYYSSWSFEIAVVLASVCLTYIFAKICICAVEDYNSFKKKKLFKDDQLTDLFKLYETVPIENTHNSYGRNPVKWKGQDFHLLWSQADQQKVGTHSDSETTYNSEPQFTNSLA